MKQLLCAAFLFVQLGINMFFHFIKFVSRARNHSEREVCRSCALNRQFIIVIYMRNLNHQNLFFHLLVLSGKSGLACVGIVRLRGVPLKRPYNIISPVPYKPGTDHPNTPPQTVRSKPCPQARAVSPSGRHCPRGGCATRPGPQWPHTRQAPGI